VHFLNKLKAERAGKKTVVQVIDGAIDDDVRTLPFQFCTFYKVTVVSAQTEHKKALAWG